MYILLKMLRKIYDLNVFSCFSANSFAAVFRPDKLLNASKFKSFQYLTLNLWMILSFAGLNSSNLQAQEFNYKALKFKEYGLNVAGVFQSLPFFGNVSPSVPEPTFVIKTHKPGKTYLTKIGLGGRFVINDAISSNSILASLGQEKYNYLDKHWFIINGYDFSMSYAFNNEDIGVGVSYNLGIGYDLNTRMVLSTYCYFQAFGSSSEEELGLQIRPPLGLFLSYRLFK